MVRKWMSPVSIEFFNISILQSNYDAAPTAFSITIKKKKNHTTLHLQFHMFNFLSISQTPYS